MDWPPWYWPWGEGTWYCIAPEGAINVLKRANLEDAATAVMVSLLMAEDNDPEEPYPPEEETCWVTGETDGVCIYTCRSGTIHTTVAGPLGCVDPKNFPVPSTK